MVTSKSKGAIRLNNKGMRAWEKRIQKAKEKQQERQQQSSGNTSSALSSSA